MVRVLEGLAGDWRRLDERIEGLSNEIEAIARLDAGCERLISVPGIGPILSSAMVAAIGAGDVFSKGRDFAAWLGLVPRQISTGDRTILGKISKRGKTLLYRASKLDCDICPLKPRCCPQEPPRKIPRDIHEHARDVARSFAGTDGFEQSRRERKKIEMRFAHLKRILRLGRLRLRGPRGAQDEFVLAAIAQNLRRLATLVARPPPAQVLCIA